MKTIKVTIILIILLFSAEFPAQLLQTVRGTVTDKVSQAPVPGAVVVVLNTQPALAATTGADGSFRLESVPVGKIDLKISMVGYLESQLRQVNLHSGKELVLTINLEEEIAEVETIEITAKTNKNKPLNEMSSVSTRAFSVEETQKFAAAVNDPLRMATSFAGVIAPNDGNNHISIRGNSPNGLLWRMEGVEIPNPNHFANVGTSGGGISILSAQLLNNSDFSTGAFAAEYGNALSGVFDLRLRKGNNEKREYTFQAGLLGIDAAAEGPLTKGGTGSYLVNYRYSTLSVLGKIGVPLGDAITNFQDLSFNVSMPTKKIGTFGLFGFGGLSSQTTEHDKDTAKWREDLFYRLNTRYFANTGMAGLSHTALFGNAYLKTVLAASATQNGYIEDEMAYDFTTPTLLYRQSYLQDKITLSSVYTRKLSSRSSFRTGVIFNRLGFDLSQKERLPDDILKERLSNRGNTGTAQGFFQLNRQLTSRLVANAGLHFFHVFLNNTRSLEPRASLKYELNRKNNLSLGYGLHSQIQPLGAYFATVGDGATALPNRNLDLTKAHHVVAGYDRVLNDHAHVKTEVYYQHLFDVPVSTDQANTYSMLNNLDGYHTGPLDNSGLGRNTGVEITYERFLHNNLYWLYSASLYDSKYRTAGGDWFNTRFNTNFAFSATGGKEWMLRGTKSRILGFNLKGVYIGGFRYTPIDLAASLSKGETVFVTGRTFAEQVPSYFRLDLRLSLKRNYRHLTSTVALDIQNTTNRKNVGGQNFDLGSGEVKYWYQTPLIPVLSYRAEF